MSISHCLSLDRVSRVGSLSSFSIGQQRSSASRIHSARHSPPRPVAVIDPSDFTGKASPTRRDSPFRQSLIAAGLAAALAISAPHALAEAAVAAADGAAAGSAAAASAVAEACSQQLEAVAGADFNVVVGVACALEFVALTGAAVGGYVARQQGAEMERINAQLRQINLSLRRQARVETYAPSLTYSPPPASAATPAAGASPMAEAAAAPAAEAAATATAVGAAVSVGSEEKAEVLRILKEGKKHLRDGHPGSAFVEFHVALSKAKEMGDAVEEKKAARGLGASCQRQGKFKEAISYHQLVLEKSASTGEHSGDTEAYGAIADCYTELRDSEKAATYYDKYISRLEQDSDEE
ncbi:hypothetical protein CLOM_g5868 [Closterium sp. NIES-68]|nr:hypothetical protein CLOM_g5868 [Closterium sp. NIES-68]GJP76480.1 hypothetical protein CLOP_g6922 [Closterium sp. NIES-67]